MPIIQFRRLSSSACFQGLLKRARVLALLCLVGLLLPLASHLLAASDSTLAWLIDLACHWQWLYVCGLLVFGALAAWADRGWACLLLALPLPWLTAAPSAPTLAQGVVVLSVVSANVHLENDDAQSLRRWLGVTRPDVVILLEVSPAYAAGLQGLSDYPHQQLLTQEGPFSMALLSRHPLFGVEVLRDADGIPGLAASLDVAGQRVRILAEHPMPPLSRYDHVQRNQKLAARAAEAAASALPSVLAGDLNATPWSSAFAGLAGQGLRRASGITPTWPAIGRAFPGIPIDHVLVSSHWAVVSTARGPDLGSDHYPVLVRLALPASRP
ncbi:endonuclease/exonuclease/phosphatase family protein [Uliginosibacterium flavum]|uniref:Endonuclease/exonuclease/phosphatase family protein n=1 Tax=Uliginosibacterium flavum TaxID=1396831 RepID=A0ABV2TQR5_9RHOO